MACTYSPYSSFGRNKIEPIMFYEGINAKVFWRSIAFAITVVVTSRSNSFEYTMSVHAVHAGGEKNVCNIVISTEIPQINHQSISNAAPHVQTSIITPAPYKSSPPRPHTFSSTFLRRCPTELSIRSCPPVQIYLKSLSFIYMEIYVSTRDFVT